MLFLTEFLLSVPLPALKPLLSSVHTHSLSCPLQNQNRGISCLPCSETGKKSHLLQKVNIANKNKMKRRKRRGGGLEDRQTNYTNYKSCLVLVAAVFSYCLHNLWISSEGTENHRKATNTYSIWKGCAENEQTNKNKSRQCPRKALPSKGEVSFPKP